MQEAVQLLEPEDTRYVGLPSQHLGGLDLLEFLAVRGADVLDLILDVEHGETRHVHV